MNKQQKLKLKDSIRVKHSVEEFILFSCEGKEKLDFELASKIKSRNNNKRSIYKCRYCSYYHIGGK